MWDIPKIVVIRNEITGAQMGFAILRDGKLEPTVYGTRSSARRALEHGNRRYAPCSVCRGEY